MSTPVPPPPGGTPLPPPPATGGQGTWPTPPSAYGNQPTSYGGGPGAYGSGSAAYANWGSRAGATLLRGLSLLPAYVPALLGLAIGGAISDVLGVLLAIAGAVYILAVVVRFFIQRGHLGTDVADAVLGQQVIRESTGAPLGSGWSAFGRYLLGYLNSLPFYLGWLWPLWDAKRQTFADKMINTVVVARQSRHTAGELFRNAYEVWKPVIKS